MPEKKNMLIFVHNPKCREKNRNNNFNMKKIFTLLAALLFAATSQVKALVEGLNGDYAMSMGLNVISKVSTDKWYVLYNQGRKVYVYGNANNTATPPKDGATVSNAYTYMVRLVETGTEGKYYIQTAEGNYFKNLINNTYNGVTANQSEAARFAAPRWRT